MVLPGIEPENTICPTRPRGLIGYIKTNRKSVDTNMFCSNRNRRSCQEQNRFKNCSLGCGRRETACFVYYRAQRCGVVRLSRTQGRLKTILSLFFSGRLESPKYCITSLALSYALYIRNKNNLNTTNQSLS